MAGDWSAIGEVDWWGIERNLHARRDAIGTRREYGEKIWSQTCIYISYERCLILPPIIVISIVSETKQIICVDKSNLYLYIV